MPDYYEPPEAGVGGPEPIAPIVPEEPRSDEEVTEGVKSALFLDPDLASGQFEVSTKAGVVHLKGTAKDEATKQRALDLARGVQGVTDVRDEVSVKSRR